MASGANSDGIGGTGPVSGRTGTPMGRTLRAGEIPLTVVQCVHAAECAGCPLIHLDYAQQLAAKRARVVTATSHYPALELLYTRPVTPAEPMIGYRGRAKLIISPEGRIGLYARSGNHEVVDIPNCRVLAPALAEVAAALRELCLNPPEAARALLLPYNPFGGGVLRALDLREVRLSSPSPFLSNQYGQAAPQSTREVPSTPSPDAAYAPPRAAVSTPVTSSPAHLDPPYPPARPVEPSRVSPVPMPPVTPRPDVIYRSTRDPVRRTEHRRGSDPAIDVLRRSRSSDD